ncbi:MAG: hypothetical protein HYR94_04930 [Chloroflexi bacterium]|nr:hypothetical protein [Chloroflexota bacterium]
MPDFLSKLFGRQPVPQPTHEDTDLEQFFTDAEHARQIFEQLINAVQSPKRLLVIHGVGGVGKSTLLKMYRLACHRRRLPVALVGGEEVPSPIDLLAGWAEDLSAYGVKLPTFSTTLTHYRALQVKVEAEAKKSGQAMTQAAEKLGKAAAKTAVEMAASTIPVVGPLAAALGGAGAEALVDWLRGFLARPDLELYLDPTKRLTDDFLNDMVPASARQRIALLTDTYEQMTTLDDWMRDLARRLPDKVLLVIAGRDIPKWDRAWQGWMGKVEIVELKEMTPDDLRLLVRRYYAHIRRGEPDPQQVEAIVQFARGLPIAATTVVQLWVRHGVEDFQTVRPQVVADLVDRLLEGVPPEMRPAFEVAAVLRHFNAETLRGLLDGSDAEGLYVELRRWPFIRPRREGLAVHDSMREMMNEALHVRTPERFHALHERAIEYYEAKLTGMTGEETERLGLERLYHRICANEEVGMRLFQEMAQELVSYRQVNRLRTLLNDTNTHLLERENSRLWREYYNTRLAHMEARSTNAEKVYEAIGQNEHAEPKLRAYALCDLGHIWTRNERLSQPGGGEKALNILGRSQRLAPRIDAKLISIFWYIHSIYTFNGEWEKGIEFLEQQRQFFQQNDDKYGVIYTLGLLRHGYGSGGNWKKAADITLEGLQAFKMMPETPFLRVRLIGYAPWNLIWSGRYAEADQEIRQAVSFTRQVGDLISLPYYLENLGFVLGLQRRYDEAAECFSESTTRFEQRSDEGARERGIGLGFWGAILTKQGELDKAGEYLLQSLSFKRRFQDNAGIPELFNWLGELHEAKAKQTESDARTAELALAESYCRQTLDYRWTGRRHFECGALTGLVRVKHAQGDYAAIPPLVTEAEQLAQQYEYNDHLASLRLTQGYVAWEGHILEWGSGFEVALRFYQQALIYALRYNRFLLDEVLWGGGVTTPLRLIIPHCQGQGEEGRRMLTALRDWWQVGLNDIGTPRPDTISPIPENIPLLEAERIAREREPGDGSPQQTLVEQIEAALQKAKEE